MLGLNKLNENIEKTRKKEQQKEQKKLGTIKPHRGHTLFEVNKTTGEITEAEFVKTDISFHDAANGIKPKNHKVIVKENCLYVPALNKKNVIKKLKKHAIR